MLILVSLNLHSQVLLQICCQKYIYIYKSWREWVSFFILMQVVGNATTFHVTWTERHALQKMFHVDGPWLLLYKVRMGESCCEGQWTENSTRPNENRTLMLRVTWWMKMVLVENWSEHSRKSSLVITVNVDNHTDFLTFSLIKILKS